jgi:alanine racemase
MYKKAIGSGILAPIVKSNAYGHGLLEISQLCQESPDDARLYTASLSDAVLLRKNRIT